MQQLIIGLTIEKENNLNEWNSDKNVPFILFSSVWNMMYSDKETCYYNGELELYINYSRVFLACQVLSSGTTIFLVSKSFFCQNLCLVTFLLQKYKFIWFLKIGCSAFDSFDTKLQTYKPFSMIRSVHSSMQCSAVV